MFTGFYRAFSLNEEVPITKVHTMDLKLTSSLAKNKSNAESIGTRLRELSEAVRDLEEVGKEAFERHCRTGLYSLNFHELDLLLKDSEMF